MLCSLRRNFICTCSFSIHIDIRALYITFLLVPKLEIERQRNSRHQTKSCQTQRTDVPVSVVRRVLVGLVSADSKDLREDVGKCY